MKGRAMEGFITIKHTDDKVSILEICKGHIMTEDYDELKDEFDENLPECHDKIILDMTQVEYISSLILTALMYMLKKATEVDKELVLKGITPKVMEILSSTGLDRIFNIEN